MGDTASGESKDDRDPTQTLIDFASQSEPSPSESELSSEVPEASESSKSAESTDGASLPTFDGADVSSARIGASAKGKPWWDEARGGLKLRSRTLAGASLSRADLSGADLHGANLRGIKGVGLVLRNACLEGADLTEADLIGANLSGVSAGEANFTGALLEDADLRKGELRFATFNEAIMDGADLSNADLWGARFSKAEAERASFRNTCLDESSLAGAELSSADFTGTTLRRGHLAGAVLRGATFRDAVLDGADLSGADLSGAVMPNVSLATSTLTHARFAGAWLERTRMRASQLGGIVGEEQAGDLKGALDSYTVLQRNFLSLGSAEDASWAYRRRRRVGRSLHAQQARAGLGERRWRDGLLSGANWLGDAVAEWLCDYGESLPRVARAFFSILLVFAVLYWLTGSLALRSSVISRRAFTPINYLLFSLNSMTTVGTSEVALKPSGELGTLLSSLQTVIGTILLGLFGFVLGARIRK